MSKKTYTSPSLTNLGSVEEVTLWGRRSSRRRRRKARGKRDWWKNTGS